MNTAAPNRNGAQSVRLSRSNNDVTITRAIPTTGYTNLRVSYYVATQNLPYGEDLRVQYSPNGGGNWYTATNGTYTGTTTWRSGSVSLPSSCEDNSSFRVRFILSRANSGTYYGYVDDVTVTGDLMSFQLELSRTGQGSVNVNGVNHSLSTTWRQDFPYGTSITLEAIPDTANHYHFVNWSRDLSGSTNPITFTIDEDTQVRANFALDTFTLSLTGTNGEVRVGSTSHNLPYTTQIGYGTSVTLTSDADPGYAFSGWSGDLTDTADPVTFSMLSNMAIVANFVSHPSTVAVNGTHGSVRVNGGTTYPLPWSTTFTPSYFFVMTLYAVPDTGYHFVNWTGDASGTNPTTAVIRFYYNAADWTATANFAPNTHTVTFTGTGGQVQVNGVSHALPWSESITYGSTVTVQALPDATHSFTSWSGGLSGTANPTTFTLNTDADASIAVGFDALPSRHVSFLGSNGSISVNATPHALPWAGDFTDGTTLSLQVAPDTHYHFTGWSGDLSGTTNPTSLPVDGDKTVTVGLALDQYQLGLDLTGKHGSVKVNGGAAVVTYAGDFDYGTVVGLEAVPDTGYHFESWTGDASGAASTSITIDAAKTASATFVPNSYALHLDGSHGAVTVNSTSHDLPWSGMFDYGTVLNLQAVPATGYHFKSWSGGGLSGSSDTASLTLTAETTVTAEFEINHYLLSVGGSDGSVSVNGSSHDLPWSGTFDHGTTVNLVVTPSAHHHFTSWSGDLTGTTASTSLLMESAKTVTAGIEADLCAFTLNGSMGQVKVNGTLHDLPFAGEFGWGSTLTLEAVPPTGYALKKWSGDLNGSDNPASLVLDGEKTVTANFWVRQYRLTVNGTGSVLLNGESQALPFTKSYEFGAGITLEVPATTCDRFNGWESDTGDIDYTNPLAFNIDKDYSLTPLGISPLGIFSDVPCDYWAVREIAACYRAGIVAGYGDGTYQPTLVVTRDQMAVYVSRALAEGDVNIGQGPSTATFPDVPTSYWAFKYVEYAVSHGIVVGYGDGTYAPTVSVDRGQMAVYVARSMVRPLGDAGMAGYTPPTTPSFSDVGTDFWSYAYVEYLAAQGTVSGYLDGTYRPTDAVTRDQMAVYVQRAFGLAR